MILKNLIVYLQILTLTASLTNDNTGTKSNQREGSTLESINVDQYQPDLKVLKDFVSVGSKDHPSSNGWQQISKDNLYPPKQPYDPKTPTTKIIGKGPAWVKNIARHFKDKSLEEEYKKRSMYPTTFEINDGGVQLESENIEISESPSSNEIDVEEPRNDCNGMPEKKICFVDDSRLRKSKLVPCHFVSRLFYHLILHNQSNVQILQATRDGKPEQKFSFAVEGVSCGEGSSRLDISNKTEDQNLTTQAIDLSESSIHNILVEPTPEGSDGVKSPEDDISAPKKDGDMPSFDEWKMQQEEEKIKDQIKEQNSAQNHLKPKKTGKKEINYASVTCGSKVIQANPEAQNPSFMLYENKDQYMINPCSVKMGFTVELCESIQVQSIEIGNIEFFSSLPASFDVHISERFPIKEWIHVGIFHAKNERTIQNFQVERSLIYAKYIRVDILSHYGNEHFCPISVLRVFGVSLDEDDEVEVSREETDYSDIVDVNLEQPGHNKVNNLFSKATETVISLVKKVVPSASNQPEVNNDTDEHHEVSIATTLDNATRTEKFSIETSKNDILIKCLLDFSSLPHPNMERKNFSTFCKYYKLLSGPTFNPICPKLLPEFQEEPVGYVSLIKEDPNTSQTNQEMAKDVGGKVNEAVENQNFNKMSNKSSGDSSILPSKNGDNINKHSTEEASSSICSDKTSELKEPIKRNEDVTNNFRDENSQSVDNDSSKRSMNNSSNATKGGASNNQSGLLVANEGGDSSTNQKKESVDGSPRLEPLKDYEFDPSNMDDVTYQKLSSKGKESVFVKLKNRIRNLEVNLNLTNRYLEELSQRYKKQTEEMYTSLNKTISKLIITAKSAEERDIKQQERIQNLEIKFSNLTTLFTSLRRSMQDVHSEVLEQHILMMAVEFALFFALLTYCRGHRRNQSCEHQCRRASAPAIPGKVVTSDLGKVTSANQGDVGTCLKEKEEKEELDDDDAGWIAACPLQANKIQIDLSHEGEEEQLPISAQYTNHSTNSSLTNGKSYDDDDDDIVSGIISSIGEVKDREGKSKHLSQTASSHKKCMKRNIHPLPSSASLIFNNQSTFTCSNHKENNKDERCPDVHVDQGHHLDKVQSDFVNHVDDDLHLCDSSGQHLITSLSSPLINIDISRTDPQTSSPSPNILNSSRPLNRHEMKQRKFCFFPVLKSRRWSRNFLEYSKRKSIDQYFPRESVISIRVRYEGSCAALSSDVCF